MGFPLSFDNPFALLWLPVVAALLWAISRRSSAPLDRQQIAQGLVLRFVLAALIVFAIAQPHWRIRTNNLTTIFLVDRSDSIRPDQRGAQNRYVERAIASKGGEDRAGMVVFGRYPNLETRPAADAVPRSSHAPVEGDATDLAQALKAAREAFPPDTGKKIVLLTDGRETSGDAAAEAAGLARDGVAVDVAPVCLDDSNTPEVSVDAVRVPADAQKEAPFNVRVVVRSNAAQQATLTLSRDGAPIARRSISLPVGVTAETFVVREAREGLHRYDATLAAARDTVPQNNSAMACVDVHGIPRVLYVASGPPPASARVSLAAQGIEMSLCSPGSAPRTVAQWQSFDSVVLDDVAATEFAPEQLQALAVGVHDFGLGLGMVGGPHSFGAGMYLGTPIEAALPVEMRVPRRKQAPSAAVVIVLDASGSMGVEEGGVQKVRLAAQAALNLLRSLDPDDRVAVIAVTTVPRTVIPLETQSQAIAAQQDVESLSAGGGGINCRTGLVAAYDVLEQSRAPIRHVIMCADTTDSDEQEGCTDLARQEYETNHITTSMLGIGKITDVHVPFQKSVAVAGHGRMEAINNASALPSSFQRDVGYLKGSLFIEKPFRTQFTPADPLIDGVPLSSAPDLLGYNLISPKKDAAIPVRTLADGDVVLAHWRYGVGRAFAFTSDDRPRWASRWIGWDGYGRFWAQVVRWSLKNEISSGLQTAVESEEGRGRVSVDDLTPSGDYVESARLTASVAAPDGSLTQVPLVQTAPGRYEAQFDTSRVGLYMLRVRDDDHPGIGQSVALAAPYSPEYRNVPPNGDLLGRLAAATGGRMNAPADSVFRSSRTWEVGSAALAPDCLFLAALLLLLDIAWRRMALRVSFRRKAADETARVTRFGVVQVPTPRQHREGETAAADEAYLTRAASTRIGDDDFPLVARADSRRES